MSTVGPALSNADVGAAIRLVIAESRPRPQLEGERAVDDDRRYGEFLADELEARLEWLLGRAETGDLLDQTAAEEGLRVLWDETLSVLVVGTPPDLAVTSAVAHVLSALRGIEATEEERVAHLAAEADAVAEAASIIGWTSKVPADDLLRLADLHAAAVALSHSYRLARLGLPPSAGGSSSSASDDSSSGASAVS